LERCEGVDCPFSKIGCVDRQSFLPSPRQGSLVSLDLQMDMYDTKQMQDIREMVRAKRIWGQVVWYDKPEEIWGTHAKPDLTW